MYTLGPTQKKILLELLTVAALSMQTSSIRYYKILFKAYREWKKIKHDNVKRSVRRLCNEKLVKEVSSADGSFKLVLTAEGKRQARIQSLFGKSIYFKNPKEWDKKWRIVLFDVPEDDRQFRDVLRSHLRELKFYKLQQSVFISPFPCEKQLLELVSLYKASAFVRIVTADWVDNEEKLKKHFFKPAKNK